MADEEEKGQDLLQKCKVQNHHDMENMRMELESHEAVQIYKELLDIEKVTGRKEGQVITIVDDE
eukprot:3880391-Heterocapsa_arctica.AAC.1